MRLLFAQQMKALEAASDRRGVDYKMMMETAGITCADEVIRRFSPTSCVVLCGTGNNGGDGYVIARRLKQRGVNVVAVAALGLPKTSLAQNAHRTAEASGVMVVKNIDATQCRQADLLVDAVFGTGFHGCLPDGLLPLASLIDAHPHVVAIDLPSGLDADSPTCPQGTFHATLTLCLAAAKPAALLLPASAACGEIAVIPIGIPEAAWEEIGQTGLALSLAEAVALLPARAPLSHKGDYGRLLTLCGSAEYPGAATLSAMAALKSGVGLVTVAAVPPVAAAVAAQLPEATLLPLNMNESGRACSTNMERILERAEHVSTLLIGCGLGRDDDIRRLVRVLLEQASCRMILDADGLNALTGEPERLRGATHIPLVTPHVGEMACLTGLTPEQIKETAPHVAQDFACACNAVVVLKDASTVVAAPDGRLFYYTGGNPGMARGGSGDLLAGLIASLLGQGMEPVVAAAVGVVLHGEAGRRCAVRLSQYGMLPHELLQDLREIFLEGGR
ncbi:MAG: NAD(P)H-hydrate dehydratase [Oscillospiraceae bacterium]